jgi:cell wall-associated NlpC family hydrolase
MRDKQQNFRSTFPTVALVSKPYHWLWLATVGSACASSVANADSTAVPEARLKPRKMHTTPVRTVSLQAPRLSTVSGEHPASTIAEARSADLAVSRRKYNVLPVAASRVTLPVLAQRIVPQPRGASVVSSRGGAIAAARAVQVAAVAPKAMASSAKAGAKAIAKSKTQASASAKNDDKRILLAQLEADLRRAQNRLDDAKEDLSAGEKQLSRFTDTLRQAMLEAGPDATGLHPFVRTAQRYAGTPYVWGGESARGFDCSGFIIRVMRDLGYRALPHSAAEQFRYGTPIAEALLKPGDLVFFANTYKPGISHVGIYLGRRRFIHAAGTGKGTIVSTLDSSPYREKYAGARRLVAARR